MRSIHLAVDFVSRMAHRVRLNVCWGMLLCVAVILADVETQAQQLDVPVGPRELFVVPQLVPRDSEGARPEEQVRRIMPRGDTPIGSFVESLKGNDAAIEVVVGQGRILTLKRPISTPQAAGVVAVGDPNLVDFEVLPNPQMIRLFVKRAWVTDLSVTTGDGQAFSFEIRVTYDLDLFRAQLAQVFPDAKVNLAQIRNHIVVEGQARSTVQVQQIIQTVQYYLSSASANTVSGSSNSGTPAPAGPPGNDPNVQQPAPGTTPTAGSNLSQVNNATADTPGGTATGQVINLLQVPTSQQVMLKVKIAELNRTALRQIGADIYGVSPGSGNIFGTNLGASTAQALATLGMGGLTGTANTANATGSTGIGIFPSSDFEIIFKALRKNSLLNILAEPNLIAMSGHRASFLAGGQFPVPVPQGAGGVTNNVTIQFKDFGVQLDFVPVVLDDERVRLSVTPEVSSIDQSLGTTLVAGGLPVPGLNTRRATTTVELRQSQTLAIAGLLQVQLDAQTARIPGLGDLPYLGPMFRNNSHNRVEKELVVMVTPYLVEPAECNEIPPLPGTLIQDPDDLEFYLMGRIQGRTGQPYRATNNWDDPRRIMLEKRYLHGATGYSQ